MCVVDVVMVLIASSDQWLLTSNANGCPPNWVALSLLYWPGTTRA